MALIAVEDKYERQGWPSLARPDLKPPAGWSLSLVTAVHRVHHQRLSPDGRRLAFVWDRDDLSDIYLLPLSRRGRAAGWPARVSLDRAAVAYWSDEAPTWSPDGRRLAFSANGHVHVCRADGSGLQRISDFSSGASSPQWLADSQQLVVAVERAGSTQLVLTDSEGRWPQPLITDPGGDCWDAQASPDGRFVSFTFRPFADLHRLDLRLVELETGQVRTLAGAPGLRQWGGRWSPDGRLLAYLSQQTGWNEVWLAGPDSGQAWQLSRCGRDVADLAWSPDSARLVVTVHHQGAYELALVEVATGEFSPLRHDAGVYTRPEWSPDGSWLTVAYEAPRQPPDLFRVDLQGRVTALSSSNPPGLAAQSLVEPEPISYTAADGLEIPAFLYRPEKPNGAAVLYAHGGPSAQYALEWDILAQYFVAKGYTWLCPNYRGSTGYGVAFEHANYHDWGVGDAQDCLQGARYLNALPGVDAARVAVYGSSYGGYLAACCLSRDPDYLFACGVDKSGDANTLTSWAQCRRALRLYSEIFLGHPAQRREDYLAASPIYQVDNIQKPVLILHGLLDDVVPPQASEEWVEALRRAGKTYEYKTYAGEPHGFLKRRTQLDAYGRIERFLDWYLMPGLP